MAEKRRIVLRVNGETREGYAEPRRTLADFLRDDLALTGTHIGCEHGVCGACTVWLDDEPVRSCLLFAVQAEGHEITTIEGLSSGDSLHPVQEAFIAHHALQCGFCTPGLIMLAAALVRDQPHLTRDEIRAALAGNICRCTGYQFIVDAVADVAARIS